MTYEQNQDLAEYLLSDFADELTVEDTYLLEPAAAGMRVLDYEPDLDSYEYQQSRY